MPTYYKGNLPQGVDIVTKLDPSFRYIIPPSRVMSFPFSIRAPTQQVVIDMANTTPFQNVYIPGVRSYASSEPFGISLTSAPRAGEGSINLPPSGAKWNFWLIELEGTITLAEANINHWIYPGTVYYMNVQNLQNRENYFFCRFTYTGPGVNIVE
jgi:hypothetical protein